MPLAVRRLPPRVALCAPLCSALQMIFWRSLAPSRSLSIISASSLLSPSAAAAWEHVRSHLTHPLYSSLPSQQSADDQPTGEAWQCAGTSGAATEAAQKHQKTAHKSEASRPGFGTELTHATTHHKCHR